MAKKKGIMPMHEWLRTDEVLGYIINSYHGVEPAPTNHRVMRRVFLWEEEGEVKMGNAEAFTLHLGRRFERKVSAQDASHIHQFLRDLGESITPHQRHEKPRTDGPRAGKFRQPDPDEWIVRSKG